MTYGDGLADVDIAAAIAFHRSHGKLATVTAVNPPGRFGVLDVGGCGRQSGIREKPERGDAWINGGFFVLEPDALGTVEGDHVSWERSPMEQLAASGQLMGLRARRLLAAHGHAAREDAARGTVELRPWRRGSVGESAGDRLSRFDSTNGTRTRPGDHLESHASADERRSMPSMARRS
jgi:NDP-sugar pyrophosphorylase family protein